MSRSLAVIVLGELAVPHAAGATATWDDRTPAAITVAAPASRKCQDTIAKAGTKYLGSKLKALSKCKLKSPALAWAHLVIGPFLLTDSSCGRYYSES